MFVSARREVWSAFTSMSPDRWRQPNLRTDSDPARARHLHAAVRLSVFTILWNCATGAAALAAAIVASSPALAAFALSALLDSSASVILVRRFRTEQRDPAAAEHLERRAHGWVSAAMVAVGIYVLVQAVRAL